MRRNELGKIDKMRVNRTKKTLLGAIGILLIGCGPAKNSGAELSIAVCLRNLSDVAHFTSGVKEISEKYGFEFSDDSAMANDVRDKIRSNNDVKIPRKALVNLFVTKEKSLILYAVNDGMPDFQILVGFVNIGDDQLRRSFVDRSTYFIAENWQAEVVLPGSSTNGVDGCNPFIPP